MVQLIKSMMGGWEISGNKVVVGDELPRIVGDELPTIRRRGGWLDDRMQLKLPEETAAASFRRCFFTCNPWYKKIDTIWLY